MPVRAALKKGAPGGLSLADCRVLVVDDQRFARETLGRFLRWIGIGRIDYAADGQSGIDRLLATPADLVLLDTDMPGIDGLEVCRRLREMPQFADLPIIMQTSAVSDPAGVKCFEAGASDIITKPVNPGECMARVRLHLEKILYLHGLREFHHRLETDLRLARDMQLSLIPGAAEIKDIEAAYGISIEIHFAPSDELGGDFLSIMPIGPQQLGLLMADFSGHGVAAAINTFRFHTILERLDPREHSPEALLHAINRPLNDLLPTGQFATCLYGVLDVASRTFRYAAAASPCPIIYERGFLRQLTGTGLMLGITEELVCTTDTVLIPEGATLLFCSDAVQDAFDANGQQIGEDGVAAIAAEALAGSPPFLPRFQEGLYRRGLTPLRDDLTILCVTLGASTASH